MKTNNELPRPEQEDNAKPHYAFHRPPDQPGNSDCDTCFGLGWKLEHDTIVRCEPCNIYVNDNDAILAARDAIKNMYVRLQPDEHLATGHGFTPFVLKTLEQLTDTCPTCEIGLVAVEAGYDRYSNVTLEDKVLVLEHAGFSDDGNGPDYLFCDGCENAYTLPKEIELR